MGRNFSTTAEAFDFLGSFINFERSRKQTIRDYRLDRMKELLKHFGNPEKLFKTIHLAGSKGKGSTAMFIASALNAAGEAAGLYSSPHISDYRERITLGGSFFDPEIYTDAVSEIAAGLESFNLEDETGSSDPTTFELLTLMAFIIFKNTGCVWGIIETGIGGRLDATNVILPAASVITHIEIEHADILGDTIEKIATEKAGIIKQGVPVFTGNLESVPSRIIKEKAGTINAPLNILKQNISNFQTELTPDGTKVSFVSGDNTKINLNLNMTGRVQAENAALAWFVLNKLLRPDETILKLFVKGINQARLPGRFEIIRTKVAESKSRQEYQFIFDGAHTPVSIKRLLETWQGIFKSKGILIFGSVSDKNPAKMAKLLCPHFESIIISTPGTFKESFPDQVYEIFKEYGDNVLLIKDPVNAYKKALEFSKGEIPVLVTGSFYMVSEIRKLVVE